MPRGVNNIQRYDINLFDNTLWYNGLAHKVRNALSEIGDELNSSLNL